MLRALGYKIRRLHYTLEHGLELPNAEARLESLFAAYEAPNYFAAKDEAVFDQVLTRANSWPLAPLSDARPALSRAADAAALLDLFAVRRVGAVV